MALSSDFPRSTSSSTAVLRAERTMLLARYDSGADYARDFCRHPRTRDRSRMGRAPARGAVVNAPVQLSMFTATTPSSSPVGLSVVLPKPCRSCGADTAVIGSSAGPHHASLACSRCGVHRGWLSGTTFRFLSDVIDGFGRPTEPIVIRHNQSVPTTDATAQAVTATALTTKGP